jgi:F0F1-type ATP synthase membrane subunit b/b'
MIESRRQYINRTREDIQNGKETFKNLHAQYATLLKDVNASIKISQAEAGVLYF